jgi:hypothetical protein
MAKATDGRRELTEHVLLLSVEGHFQLCCEDLFGHEEDKIYCNPKYMGVIRKGREHAHKCESRKDAGCQRDKVRFSSGQAKSLSLSIVAHLEEATPHSDLPKGLTCYLTAPATLQT